MLEGPAPVSGTLPAGWAADTTLRWHQLLSLCLPLELPWQLSSASPKKSMDVFLELCCCQDHRFNVRLRKLQHVLPPCSSLAIC